MLAKLVRKLRQEEELSEKEVVTACERLIADEESFEEKADFLRALNQKGETAAEMAAFVRILLELANKPEIAGENVLDICGTGGDGLGLFNISTATMFVVAAGGVPVVKHGNRGLTSKSGGADVLEALGVRLDHPPDRAGYILDTAGCVFLFAPFYHLAFQAIGPVRRALAAEGSPTIFNKLGPLLNPVRPAFQLAGVYDEKLLPIYAETFRLLGRERAWAIHGRAGDDGMDEVSTLGPTRVMAVEDNQITEREILPGTFGFAEASLSDLQGGTAEENAGLISDLLRGTKKGPCRDIVVLNAAAALVTAGAASDLFVGVALAEESLNSGAAMEVLRRLRSV